MPLLHGHAAAQTPTYTSWEAMRQRCNNPHNDYYHCYGGIGIKVCKRWDDFRNFYNDMGPRPHGMTLDRKDANKNYCKDNCRWATPLEQSNNKVRSNSRISKNQAAMIRWDKRTLKQIAQQYGVGMSTISRIRRGITHQ